MKSLTLRSSVVLACALSLAGCGAGNKNLLLSGSISGVNQIGLVLQNNGELLSIPVGASTFSFVNLLSNDEAFNVTVQTAIPSADCTVTNGAGKTGAYNITSVVVTCVTHTHQLGGTITGNVSDMVIVNGPDSQVIKANASDFTMAPVAEGSPYGVTILTPPTGLKCTVQNGVGTMGTVDLKKSIQVACQ